ncbi:cytochrome c oxidase subunit iii subfamily protein, partial [Cardiosporidium cionae]
MSTIHNNSQINFNIPITFSTLSNTLDYMRDDMRRTVSNKNKETLLFVIPSVSIYTSGIISPSSASLLCAITFLLASASLHFFHVQLVQPVEPYVYVPSYNYNSK